MKTFFVSVVLFAAFAVFGQTTPFQSDMDSQINRELALQPPTLHSPQPLKANEVKVNGRTYSGILVELTKTDKPLELINPWAPAEYGSPEDNTVRDSDTGQIPGWKLFSIEF